jgi:hypothetical protein
MGYKVLIAGAGQIGCRYLQGMVKFTEPLTIWVYDISPSALANIKIVWDEACLHEGHQLVPITNLSKLPEAIDLSVVATTADVRVKLVEEIDDRCCSRFWILEKVLAQNLNDLMRLEKIFGEGQGAWVNTPRLFWDLYRSLRQLYIGNETLNASFDGFPGLACNAVHFIDLICGWKDTQLAEVDTRGLSKEWFESKRVGFYEIEGTLLMRFADGSRLNLSCSRHNEEFRAKLRVGEDEWIINESAGIAVAKDGRCIKAPISYQSQITAPIMGDIFAGKLVGLPTIRQSIGQHAVYLKSMLSHWNACMPDKLTSLPIT